MPYLPLDLDGKKKIPKIAKATGVSPGDILWGLAEMWEHVWATKRPVVGEMVLDGCFGLNPRVRDALVAFDFLEPVETGWRVRGAERFLGVSQARSDAAKATNAKRWGATDEEDKTSLPGRSSDGPAMGERLLPVALSPNTQHPTPRIHIAPVVSEKTKADELVELWNAKANPKLPRWRKLNPARRKSVNARLEEEPDLAEWAEVIERIGRSPFCLGENNRKWRAGPEFLLRPTTFARVLEGEFDGGGQAVERKEEPACVMIR